MLYLLDTHVWLWAVSAPERLSEPVHDVLVKSEIEPQLIISAISLVEIAMLVEKNRLKFTAHSVEEWISVASEAIAAEIVPVTNAIAVETSRLDGFDHFDPADRIIAATAITEKAVLLSADRKLRAYARLSVLW